MFNEFVLNSFYLAFKRLIDYETGKTQGSMSSPFFAISQVVGLLTEAEEKGDVIAPFFLDYIAGKYPGYIDGETLPKLHKLPVHKSLADDWVRDYSRFLQLHEEIKDKFVPKVRVVRSSRQAEVIQRLKNKSVKKLIKSIEQLAERKTPVAGVLAARLYELTQSLIGLDLKELIIDAFEKSAFYPNVFGMYEYFQYLTQEGQFEEGDSKHKKLKTELTCLQENQGHIDSLVKYYHKNLNQRYLIQWLCQSAAHGHIIRAYELMNLYLEGAVEWNDAISKRQKFQEAIAWCDWIFEHISIESLTELMPNIDKDFTDSLDTLRQHPERARIFAYLLSQLFMTFNELAKQTSVEEIRMLFCSPYSQMYHNYRAILSIVLDNNHQRLPSELSNIADVANEVSVLFLDQGDYSKSELYARKALALDSENSIFQFNLANALNQQKKNPAEQIKYFFLAAEQGCVDSIMMLYEIFVIQNQASVEQFERLESMLKALDDTVELPLTRDLLISFIKLTISQKSLPSPILTWAVQVNERGRLFTANFDYSQQTKSESDDQTANSALCDSRSGADGLSHDHTSFKAAKHGKSELSKVGDCPSSRGASSGASPEASQLESSSSPGFFKQAAAASSVFDGSSRQVRAKRVLSKLLDKPTRKLTIKDFVKAQRAYNELTQGEHVAIEISHKGRSSGSRVKIGGVNWHLPHGRDRMSIGAQTKIHGEIETMYDEVSDFRPNS